MDRDAAALESAQETLGSELGMIVPFFPESLRQQCRIVTIDAGQTVFKRPADRKHFHRVVRGDVSIRREIMGETVTVQRAMAGDWLVEPGMNMQSTGAIAFCERQSELLAVPVSALMECLDRHPGFAHAWCLEMGAQMARLQRYIERIRLRHAPQRVMHYLATESSGGCGEMALPFPQSVWAAQLGMVPETLSRALTDLIDAGWVERAQGNRYRLLRRG